MSTRVEHLKEESKHLLTQTSTLKAQYEGIQKEIKVSLPSALDPIMAKKRKPDQMFEEDMKILRESLKKGAIDKTAQEKGHISLNEDNLESVEEKKKRNEGRR